MLLQKVISMLIQYFVFTAMIGRFSLENTDNPYNAEALQILRSKPKRWQDSLYKFYFRTNRYYKKITYYAWRFSEIHSYKLVLLVMVLTAILKVILLLFSVRSLIFVHLGLRVQCHSDCLGHDWPHSIAPSQIDQYFDADFHRSLHSCCNELSTGDRQKTNYRSEYLRSKLFSSKQHPSAEKIQIQNSFSFFRMFRSTPA